MSMISIASPKKTLTDLTGKSRPEKQDVHDFIHKAYASHFGAPHKKQST